MIDFVGHIGYGCLVAGSVLLARRKSSGWLLRVSGDAIWLVLGVVMGYSSIYVWSAIFAVADTLGYRHWKRTHDRETTALGESPGRS